MDDVSCTSSVAGSSAGGWVAGVGPGVFSGDLYDDTRRAYVDIGRRAYDNGYSQGFEDGRDDARRRRPFSLERHGEYRDAERGYRRGYGERDPYRVGFRRGFEAGYRDAFNRYGNYERRR